MEMPVRPFRGRFGGRRKSANCAQRTRRFSTVCGRKKAHPIAAGPTRETQRCPTRGSARVPRLARRRFLAPLAAREFAEVTAGARLIASWTPPNRSAQQTRIVQRNRRNDHSASTRWSSARVIVRTAKCARLTASNNPATTETRSGSLSPGSALRASRSSFNSEAKC